MGLYYRDNSGSDMCISGNVDTSKIDAYKSVKVGTTTISASSTDQAIELEAGDNITLTPDATNHKVKIESTGGGSIDKIKVNGTEQTISSTDKSVDLTIKNYVAGDNITLTPDSTESNKITISSADAPQYVGATSSQNATSGMVPAATSAEKDKYLKGDGTWGEITVPTVTDTYSATSTDAMSGKAVASAISGKQDELEFATEYDASTNKVATESDIPTVMTGASETDNGKIGLVPTPTAGSDKRYLDASGNWTIPDAARFAKSTGVKNFEAGATEVEVDIVLPDNNYVMQMYFSNPNAHVKKVTYISDKKIKVEFNKQGTMGTLYVITTEAEYPSNVDTVVTGLKAFGVGDTECEIALVLEDAAYTINAYSTNLDTIIKSQTYADGKLTVEFNEAAKTAGSIYAMARKVE